MVIKDKNGIHGRKNVSRFSTTDIFEVAVLYVMNVLLLN
jgi:hypothetical protein